MEFDNTGLASWIYESTLQPAVLGGGGQPTDLDNVSFTKSGAVANGLNLTTYHRSDN